MGAPASGGIYNTDPTGWAGHDPVGLSDETQAYLQHIQKNARGRLPAWAHVSSTKGHAATEMSIVTSFVKLVARILSDSLEAQNQQ